jgi:hypothetical protein
VLERYWSDARYEETLGLLVSVLFQEGRYQEIDEGIFWLIEWGQETHRTDPHLLWKINRSPLRTALHILSRSAMHLDCAPLPQLEDTLRRCVLASKLRKGAIATDTAELRSSPQSPQ